MLPSLLWASGAPGVLDGRTDVAAAFGMRRLLSAYGTGPALDLVRDSDGAATTAYFGADGGIATVTGGGSLAAWLGAGTARVSRWYDQAGGGNHAVQATTGLRPGLKLSQTIGNVPSLIFDGQYLRSNGSGSVAARLVIPDTLTGLSSRGLSAFVLARYLNCNRMGALLCLPDAVRTGTRGAVTLTRFGDGTAELLQLWGPTGSGGAAAITGNGKAPPQSARCHAAVLDAAATRLHAADGTVGSGAACNAVTLQGGMVGAFVAAGNSANWPGVQSDSGLEGEIGAVVILSAALASGPAEALRRAIQADFAAPGLGAGMGALLFMGDSITEGGGSSYGRSNPRLVEGLGLAAAPAVYNAGKWGTNVAGVDGIWSSYASALAVAGARNLLVLSIGSNDLLSRAASAIFGSDDTTAATIRRRVAVAKAAGWRVLLGTVLPRSDLTAAQETERQALNALIRGNASALGYAVVDYAAIPQMSATPPAGSSAWFYDGVHPNDAGYALMAALAQPAVNAALLA